MFKATLFILICLALSHQIIAFKTDFSVGVGPAWNQVVAIEHFTLNNQNNAQAKTIITGLDNPCAAIAGNLAFTYCDKYYLQLVLYEIAGNKGSVFFNEKVQDSPFNVLSDLDGRLSTNVFEIALINGVNLPITRNLGFTLGGGYLYFNANRPICFNRNEFHFRVHDVFNGGIVKCGPTFILNDKISASAFYLFGLGNLTSRVRSFNPANLTIYKFPFYMNNIVILEGSYKITEKMSASVSAVWYVLQNIKNGRVKQSAADELRFSNRCATLFRSQFYFMTFNLSYQF
jgi:hypothetical protein